MSEFAIVFNKIFQCTEKEKLSEKFIKDFDEAPDWSLIKNEPKLSPEKLNKLADKVIPEVTNLIIELIKKYKNYEQTKSINRKCTE